MKDKGLQSGCSINEYGGCHFIVIPQVETTHEPGARNRKITCDWTMVSRDDDVVNKRGKNINREIAWNSLFLKITKFIFDHGCWDWPMNCYH